MAQTYDSTAARMDGPIHISWSAVIAGAIAASALSFVCWRSRALPVVAPAPTWLDASLRYG